jgi:hypothetical protein
MEDGEGMRDMCCRGAQRTYVAASHVPVPPLARTLTDLIVHPPSRSLNQTQQILRSAPHVGLRAEAVAFSVGSVGPNLQHNGAIIDAIVS